MDVVTDLDPAALDEAAARLPGGFPAHVADSILGGMQAARSTGSSPRPRLEDFHAGCDDAARSGVGTPASVAVSVRPAAAYSLAASLFTAASASSVISSSAMYMFLTAALSCLLSSSNFRALEKAATVPKPVIP